MTTRNINRHCYVNYNGRPYSENFGIPYTGYQNYTYVPQQENRNRTIIRTNQPNQNVGQIEGFFLFNKKQKDNYITT